MIHALKIHPVYFKEVEAGRKTFEIRKFDRQFIVGDKLLLQEFDDKEYTRKEIFVVITYILHFNEQKASQEFGLIPGFCILGIKQSDFEP